MKRMLLVVWVCISLFACDAKVQCELPLQSMSKAMDDILKGDLLKADINFVVNKDGQICVPSDSADQVSIIMHDIFVKEIPENYSDALSDPVRSMVAKSLLDMGVPFQEKIFLGATYLIWAPEHDSLVRSLITKHDAQYSDKWFKERK